MSPTAGYSVEVEHEFRVPRNERFEQKSLTFNGDVKVSMGVESGMQYVSEIVVANPLVLKTLEQIAAVVGDDLVDSSSDENGIVNVNGESVSHLALPLVNMRVK